MRRSVVILVVIALMAWAAPALADAVLDVTIPCNGKIQNENDLGYLFIGTSVRETGPDLCTWVDSNQLRYLTTDFRITTAYDSATDPFFDYIDRAGIAVDRSYSRLKDDSTTAGYYLYGA